MRGQAVSFLYVLNIIMQALFSLIFTVAIFFGIAYLLVELVGWPSFLYAVFILLGVASGIYSMVKFILSSMAALEQLERERNSRDKK